MNDTSGLSRRTVLAGATAAAIFASIGVEFVYAQSAIAAGPTSGQAAATLALSLVGKTLAELKSSPMTDIPWNSYDGEWCACFASWLMRGAGVPMDASSGSLYRRLQPVAVPASGDLIYYETPGHTGIVTSNSNGQIQTVEGNTPGGDWRTTRVKHYPTGPWKTYGVKYARPNWTNTPVPPPQNQGDDEMAAVFKVVFDQPGHQKHASRALVTPSLIGTPKFFRELAADQATQQMADKYIEGANNGASVSEVHLTGQQYFLMQAMNS